MKYLFANWKAHKNLSEARLWVSDFLDNLPSEPSPELQVVIMPPAPLLLPVKQLVANYPFISVGAQDVSALPEGAHTGEVTAQTLAGIVNYCLVGHSERRASGETEDQVKVKVRQLRKAKIEPVLCVSEGPQIMKEVKFIAFEQPSHIGSSNPTPMSEVLNFKEKYLQADQLLIYGGSIEDSNVKDYLQFDGLLIGHSSLNPKLFADIVRQCV